MLVVAAVIRAAASDCRAISIMSTRPQMSSGLLVLWSVWMTLLGCVVFVLPRTRWRDWDGWLLAVLAMMMVIIIVAGLRVL